MGEEIFAASAYITRDPVLITSIATTDVYRMIGWIVIIVGAILSTVGIDFITNILGI